MRRFSAAFSEPELLIKADETDWDNARQRVAQLRGDPKMYKPPIVDDEDFFAEIYNMAVLPYAGLYLGFATVFNPIGAIPPPATNFTRACSLLACSARSSLLLRRLTS